MMKIAKDGVGTASTKNTLRDSDGSGILPLQVEVVGTASYRVLGRVSAEAPWTEIRPADTVGFLETIAWVPELQIEVLSGTGTVTLWVAEK